jgi:hypothetical protein
MIPAEPVALQQGQWRGHRQVAENAYTRAPDDNHLSVMCVGGSTELPRRHQPFRAPDSSSRTRHGFRGYIETVEHEMLLRFT